MQPIPPKNALPSFDSIRDRMAVAEQHDGWLVDCEAAGQFLVPCRELVAALAERFDSLGSRAERPVVEICAGSGELAAALGHAGIRIVPTDIDPSSDSHVTRFSAQDALARYEPETVLGSFVPFDAGVDEAVLAFPSVQNYIVLGARIGGRLGSPGLWNHPGWTTRPLEQVERSMLTRHDVWLGTPDNAILQHGEAWHFFRTSCESKRTLSIKTNNENS